jgi:hypothetical protein
VPTPPTSAPAGSAAPALRRHLLHLVLAVVVLDAAAIVVHRVAGVEGWTSGRQQAFTVGWVAVTLAVVSVFLSRIRATRIRARRARAAGRR